MNKISISQARQQPVACRVRRGTTKVFVAAALSVALMQVAQAVPIAFFSNGTYGDTIREVPNMSAALTGLGHTVNSFSGITAGDFSAALAGNDALVFPELERRSLFPDMDMAARTTLTDYVSGGGTFVIAGDGADNAIDLLNGLFGYALVQGTFTNVGSTALQPGAAGTPFGDDPLSLDNANGTLLVTNASLPMSALSVYSDGAWTSVFSAAFGAGNVVMLGFDWFAEPTPTEWNTVLDSALALSSHSVPEPTSLLLIGAGLVAFGGARRRRRAG